MQNSLLDGIDIYGWDQAREDMVLAALIARLNVLIMGDKGMGKTLLGLRIAEAMDVASRAKGFGPIGATKVDGHSANEEDLVGYPMPPDDKKMEEARENDETLHMETILSPNTIANSEFVVLDEATRIQHHMQSRFLGMMEEGIVDGRELDLDYLFGAANPIHYAGTEVMDEALADRWEMIIPAPTYEEMDSEARHKIVQSRSVGTHEEPPDEEASVRLWEFIEEGREAFESALKNNRGRVTQYVDNVTCLINRGLRDSLTSDDPDLEVSTDRYTTTAPIGARRNAIIMNNIMALFAVSLVRGDEENISRCGKLAFDHSLVHRLHGDEPIPDESLKVAHETHKGLLQSQEERVISLIENKDSAVERVAMAFRLRARTEDTSRYIQEAHDEMRQNDENIRRHAFSYVLFNRLQNASEEGIHDLVNQRVMGLLAGDVKDIMEAAEEFSLTENDVHPKMGGVENLQKFVTSFAEKRRTPRGRAALALAIYNNAQSESSGRTNPMSSAKAKSSKYNSIIASISPCENAIEEMADYFTDLSRHQHALER